MPLFLLNIIGWVVGNWRIILVGVALFIVIIGSALVFNRCKKRPTIDLKKVDIINNANEKERKKELTEIVEDNQDVIKTVDQRTEIQNVNNVEKIAEIDAKVKAADIEIMRSKSQGHDVTGEELEKILLGESK